MKQASLSSTQQSGGISLLMTVVLMTVVTLLGLSFLYYLRFSQWPMQESLSRWSQSLGIIGQEVKKSTGITSNAGSTGALGAGLRKCKIDGKIVYSNVDCLDTNATTRPVQLHDSRADSVPLTTPKDPALKVNLGSTIQDQMIEKATK